MPIVSISLNDEILSEIDKLQTTMGFSGRSEAIRAGIRSFVSEEKQKSDLSGNIHAILLVVHNDEFDHVVSGITHNFEDLITIYCYQVELYLLTQSQYFQDPILTRIYFHQVGLYLLKLIYNYVQSYPTHF